MYVCMVTAGESHVEFRAKQHIAMSYVISTCILCVHVMYVYVEQVPEHVSAVGDCIIRLLFFYTYKLL